MFRSGSRPFEHAAATSSLKDMATATYELAVVTASLDKEFPEVRLDRKPLKLMF